jgi:putative transposase
MLQHGHACETWSVTRDHERHRKIPRHSAPLLQVKSNKELDEILTVVRLELPSELRRSLAGTNIIENMMGTVRRVSRNVKRCRSASMALCWTAAAMLEAKKGFRKLKAYKQLPKLRAALDTHYAKLSNNSNKQMLDEAA